VSTNYKTKRIAKSIRLWNYTIS